MSRQHQLTADDHVVLSWLLAQQPGRVVRLAVRVPKETKAPGVAEILGWPRARVNRALKRLRQAALVVALVYRHRRADALPFGARNVPTTNTLRLFVSVAAIDSFPPNDPSDGAFIDPSTGSLRSRDSISYPNPSSPPPRRSRKREAGSKASETPRSSHDNDHTLEAPLALPPTEREALREAEQEKCPVDAGPPGESATVGELAAAWDAEKLPELGGTVSQCRPSERAAIRRSLREVGRDQIALAILGTRTDPWLRAGRARSAVAWVFRKGNAGIRYYAELGEGLQRKAEADRRAAAQKRAFDIARDHDFRAAECARLERAKRWALASPEERQRIADSYKRAPARPPSPARPSPHAEPVPWSELWQAATRVPEGLTQPLPAAPMAITAEQLEPALDGQSNKRIGPNHGGRQNI